MQTLSLHPNLVFLQCFLSTDYGLARRLFSVTFINKFWLSVAGRDVSLFCVWTDVACSAGAQIKTSCGFSCQCGRALWPLSTDLKKERECLCCPDEDGSVATDKLFFVCQHLHASLPSNRMLCSIVEGMSDLTTVTHDYQKAASPLPVSQSTWISQSCALTQEWEVSLEGSVAAGINLTLCFLSVCCSSFSAFTWNQATTTSRTSLRKCSHLINVYKIPQEYVLQSMYMNTLNKVMFVGTGIRSLYCFKVVNPWRLAGKFTLTLKEKLPIWWSHACYWCHWCVRAHRMEMVKKTVRMWSSLSSRLIFFTDLTDLLFFTVYIE